MNWGDKIELKTKSIILFVTIMAFSMIITTGKAHAADSGCGGPCIYGPTVPGLLNI